MTYYGDPIYPLTGGRRQAEDLGISVGNHALQVTYDTTPNLPVKDGLINLTLPPPSSFGDLWMSSLHKRMQTQTGGQAPNAGYGSAVLYRGRTVSTFTVDAANTCGNAAQSQGTNNFVPTTQRGLKLVFDDNRVPTSSSKILDQDGLVEELYNGETGNIDQETYVGGGGLSYIYSTAAMPGIAPVSGLLISVVDAFGRTTQFTYEQPDTTYRPRINAITAPDGAVTRFSYDTKNNLTSVIWPDLATRQFRYELPNLPWAMTGITDEAGHVFSIYGYDAQGRSVSTQLAGGADKFTVQYTSPPTWEVTQTATSMGFCRDHHWVPPVGASVTNAAGNVSSLDAVTTNGMTMNSRATIPAGSGSGASAVSQTFDANGNVTSRVDAIGNQTCYAIDTARDLETVRVEGRPSIVSGGAANACPANLSTYAPSTVDPSHPERKITSAWHPDWALKTLEAKPKRKTTWVYNGQPDPIAGGTANCASTAPALLDGKPVAVLCARYEQATADETGAAGLLVTPIGATRAWIYTYNQYGQVLTATTPKQSLTDSLSHTTTYTYYTSTSFTGSVGHTIGDLNTVSNPLAQVTTFLTYDKAGRVLSSRDANLTVTSLTYWPRGWVHSQTVTPAAGSPLTTTYDYWPTGLLKTVTMPDASSLNYTYDDAHRLTDVADAVGNKIHYVLDDVGNRTGEQISDASGRLVSAVSTVFDNLNRVQSTTGIAH